MIRRLLIFAVFLLSMRGVQTNVIMTPKIIWSRIGDLAQMNCSHNLGASYYQMYWYKQNPPEGIQLIVFTTVGESPEFGDFSKDRYVAEKAVAERGSLRVKKLEAEDSGTYFCAVTGQGGYEPAYFGSGTKLTVLDSGINITRPTVKVLPPSNREGCEKKKTNRTLVCVATGFYPDHITVSWKVNGVSVTRGVRTDDTALRDEGTRFYSITSRLRVSYRKWFDTRSTFTCLTSFYDGSEYQEDKDSIKGVNGGGMDREYLLKSGLTAKLSYSVFIAKSFLYGLFISAVVWKIRSSVAKRYD